MKTTMPFKLLDWIDDNREHLKPPVCNKQMFESGDFIIQVVGGPNSRTDYHLDEGPELFYQVEGQMVLKTVQDGAVRGHSDRRRRDFSVAAARAALAATTTQVRRHRRRASARAARARRLHVVLRELREQAPRGVLARGGHREGSAAGLRAFLRQCQRAHVQALRHRDAAEDSRGHAEVLAGRSRRARARCRRRAGSPAARVRAAARGEAAR